MRSVLILVTADPRVSSRPAEAVRLAVGVGAWGRIGITLYLRGAATRILSEDVDDLVDGDQFTRHLPLLGERGRTLLVQQGAAEEVDRGSLSLPIVEIDDRELARVAAAANHVWRF